VGPTLSSGTGSCASAIVAAAYGGASRAVDVEAPGGTQRVEWADDDAVWLTGWAEVVFEGRWVG
jgi:diaminopimelate epimerase